ncbi:Receptor-interacting serine/threonine-protein kinase 2 [Physocladia obscura]|uniref:Receptor-interacting serine/threonine-protein kinase 2 n=1 Tax=Physocladia obscura TaxID=109957 RepID=A0AAD5T5X3_9FUNG|nr:Receptor-interacting serine/threonine-protein kinase 2 [Physocladia obscura]
MRISVDLVHIDEDDPNSGFYEGRRVAVKSVLRNASDGDAALLEEAARGWWQLNGQPGITALWGLWPRGAESPNEPHDGISHGTEPRADWCLVSDSCTSTSLRLALSQAQANHGNLPGLNRPPSIKQRLEWMLQISAAIVCLHQQSPPVIHTAINPLSILIDKQNSAKLTDIGIGHIQKLCTSGCIFQLKQSHEDAIAFYPPESFDNDVYVLKPSHDVYSFGMTLFEVFYLETPFSQETIPEKIMALIQNGGIPSPPETVTAAEIPLMCWNLIQECCSKDPLSRPTASIIYDTILYWLYMDEQFNQIYNFNDEITTILQSLSSVSSVNVSDSNDDGENYYQLGRRHLRDEGKGSKLAAEYLLKSVQQGHENAPVTIGLMYMTGIGFPLNNTQAAVWFSIAAYRGNSHAQSILGSMYKNGKGVPKNEQLANAWVLKASEQGNAMAQIKLDYMAASGSEKIEEREDLVNKALERMEKAASVASPAAHRALGAMFSTGIVVPKNDVFAAHWFENAAKAGDSIAQNEMGLLLRAPGKWHNHKLAVEWFIKAAEQGNADAQNNLGLSLQVGGGGVQEDKKAAAEWFFKAANQDHAAAQVNLGKTYQSGWGVSKNLELAVVWYYNAAKQGNADGQVCLGIMYEMGAGVQQNYRTAAEWYQKSADQGFAIAEKNLGLLYKTGLGVPQSDTLAVEWLHKAAAKNDADAQFNLGLMFETGKCVVRNHQAAMEWYQAAVRKGHVEAQNRMSRLYHARNG